MKFALPSMLAWLAALGAAGLVLFASRQTEACLEALPVPRWRGVSLKSAVLVDPQAAELAAELEPPEERDGALVLEFDRFAFDDYDSPELRGATEAMGAAGFPASISGFDGAEVLLRGYAQPIEFVEGRVTFLRLTRFPPGCCFGALPQYDEWVEVDLGEAGAKFYDPYADTSFRGRLEVGEAMDEAGALESLYRLKRARSVE